VRTRPAENAHCNEYAPDSPQGSAPQQPPDSPRYWVSTTTRS